MGKLCPASSTTSTFRPKMTQKGGKEVFSISMKSIIIFRRRLHVFEGSQKQRAGVFMPKKIRFSLRKTRRAARSSCLLIRSRTFPVTNMKQHTFGAPDSINCLFSFFENRVRSAFEIGGTRRTVAMRGSRGPGRRWLAPSILRCGWAAAASGSCSTSSRGRGAARSRQRLGSSRRRCADALRLGCGSTWF